METGGLQREDQQRGIEQGRTGYMRHGIVQQRGVQAQQQIGRTEAYFSAPRYPKETIQRAPKKKTGAAAFWLPGGILARIKKC